MSGPADRAPPDTPADPIQGRSLAGLFAAAACMLLAAFCWAIVDEVETRRPWKAIQRAYRQTRLGELRRAIARERARFERLRETSAYRQLEGRVAAEQARLERPEIVAARDSQAKRRERAQQRSDVALSRLRRLRGELDEAEWRYQKYHAESDRLRMKELVPRVDSLRAEWDRARARSRALAREQDAIMEPLAKLKGELASFRAGLERLETELAATEQMEIEIRQTAIEGTEVVDRCTTCHIGIDDVQVEAVQGPLGNHPGRYLAWHPPDQFGCTPCHRGQGRALASVKDAHGEREHWLQPMLKGVYVESSCQQCHRRPRDLEGAPMLAEGRRIFEEAMCTGCHLVEGMQDLPKRGPPLGNLASKTRFDWIVRWLQRPRAVLPLTMMPNFELEQGEAQAIAAWLVGLAGPPAEPISWAALLAKPEDDLSDEEFDRLDEILRRGEGVWAQARCSFCHARKGQRGGFPIGPDLGRAGAKLERDWVYRWVREPRAYHPGTRMPHFRLEDGDLRAVVEFILRDPSFLPEEQEAQSGGREEAKPDPATATEGERLVRHFGCFGCHEIPGMETEERVGPDITRFGSKPLSRLDFGRAAALPHTRPAWLRAKLSSPHGLGADLKMPSYDFSRSEVEALVTLLLGFVDTSMPRSLRPAPPPPTFAPAGPFGALLRDVNCLTCHRMRGTGGRIAPDLTAEGSRVKGDWLRRFLKAPDVIRPLLKQMPRFDLSDDEVEVAAAFIESALRDDRPGPERAPTGAPAEGAARFEEVGCYACHQIGARGGALGPNLTAVGRRLRPGYLRRYLQSPGRYNEGAPEPDFGLDPSAVEALAAYLGSLQGGQPK